jgi:pre-mRNA-splicing factor 18
VQIYMGVSIGNAAWPIGVTQVGLHERSAREKIRLGYSSAVVSQGGGTMSWPPGSHALSSLPATLCACFG